MECKNIIFSGHAMSQMFNREITSDEAIAVIKTGKIIKDYPNDTPFPSWLILAIVKNRAIHVVVAKDKGNSCYVITAYEPDKSKWNSDFTVKI